MFHVLLNSPGSATPVGRKG